MMKVLQRLSLTLLVLNSICIIIGQSSFLRSYNNPNEVITNVRTIKTANGDSPYIVALEGRNLLTNTFFTRIQSFDINGNLTDAYSDAYIGEPLHASSGIFEIKHFPRNILTPLIEHSDDNNRYYFKWNSGYTDHNDNNYFNGVYLPDSIQTILEFPSVVSTYFSRDFSILYYIVGGKAVINGLSKCFVVYAHEYGQDPDQNIILLPGINFVSGVLKTDEGYLGIGRSTGWTGKIVLVDSESNLLWQQDFTDGADTANVPYFTTPLIATSTYEFDSQIVVSYQNKDMVMHLARYDDQSLTDIFSLQLESYIGAIPMVVYDNRVTFAYVKHGKQFISNLEYDGSVNWTRELPGIGNFGKNSLTYKFDIYGLYYLIGGILPQGGYYLAKINAINGQIEYDYISQPSSFEISCYPNPNYGYFSINLLMNKPGFTNLELYNIKGQKVADIKKEYYPKGNYTINWDYMNKNWKRLPFGIYLVSAEQNEKRISKKITVCDYRRTGHAVSTD